MDGKPLSCINCDQLGSQCTPAAPILLSFTPAAPILLSILADWRAAVAEKDMMYWGYINTAARCIRDADTLASAGVIPS